MALNIPNLPSGMSLFTQGVDNMLKNLMEKQKMTQLAEQYKQNKAMSESHFNQELALRKAAAARAGANSDLQRQLFEQQILNWKHKNDPLWGINALQQAYNQATSQMPGGQQGGAMGAAMPSGQQGIAPPNKEDLIAGLMGNQEMPQGQGALTPEAMGIPQEMQEQSANEAPQGQLTQPQQPQLIGGMDPRVFEANPWLRGLYKKATGFDPLTETAEQKRAHDYDQKIKLERAKADLAGKTTNTNAIKTLNQNIVNGVPKVQKQIQSIINASSPLEIPGYRGSSRAQHNALVAEAADTLIKAKGWPNTNMSLHNAKQILDRGLFESDSSYRERLKNLSASLDSDLLQAKGVLARGTNTSTQPQANNDPLGIR